MRLSAEEKVSITQQFLEGKLSKPEAASKLGRTVRTIERYAVRLLSEGPEGLNDHHHSNHQKLTLRNEKEIVRAKKEGPWRSARKIRDQLNLKVHPMTVWRVEVKHGVNHLNYEGIKPIKRFVAKAANDLWQADIMGRIKFPKLGVMYLIATIDDHSRFVLSGLVSRLAPLRIT